MPSPTERALPGAEIAGRLAALLLEAALRHMRHGAAAMEAGRVDEGSRALREAERIVMDLHTALDRDESPELAVALAPIYRWVCFRLRDADLLQDAHAAREAERAFEPLADAFSQAATALEEGEPT